MERMSYKKIYDYLDSSGASKVEQLKFNSYVKLVTKTINEAKEFILMDSEKEALLMLNPRIPQLYGLLKLHKEGILIRLVISIIALPTYSLAIYSKGRFKATTQFIPKRAVISFSDLVNRLREERRINLWQVSFLSVFRRFPKYTA